MRQGEILKIFQEAGALLQGHFLLSSGLHSSQYLQCAKVLENPQAAEKLCQALAEPFKNKAIDVVIGPAMGGIILAYELARALGARALFTERQSGLPAQHKEGQAGKMCLRRGFNLPSSDKVLIAEDVVTTGGSVKEVIDLVNSCGAKIIAVCALVDRSGGKIDFGVNCESLVKLEIENFSANSCPLCKKGIELLKPGSR